MSYQKIMKFIVPLTLTALCAALMVATARAETVKTPRGLVVVDFRADGVVAALADKKSGQALVYKHTTGGAQAEVLIYTDVTGDKFEGKFKRAPEDLRELVKEPQKLALTFTDPAAVVAKVEKPKEKSKDKPKEESKGAVTVSVEPKFPSEPEVYPSEEEAIVAAYQKRKTENSNAGNKVTGGITLQGKRVLIRDRERFTYDWDNMEIRENYRIEGTIIDNKKSKDFYVDIGYWELLDLKNRTVAVVNISHADYGNKPTGWCGVKIYNEKQDVIRSYVINYRGFEPPNANTIFRVPCGIILEVEEYSSATSRGVTVKDHARLEQLVRLDFPGVKEVEIINKITDITHKYSDTIKVGEFTYIIQCKY